MEEKGGRHHLLLQPHFLEGADPPNIASFSAPILSGLLKTLPAPPVPRKHKLPLWWPRGAFTSLFVSLNASAPPKIKSVSLLNQLIWILSPARIMANIKESVFQKHTFWAFRRESIIMLLTAWVLISTWWWLDRPWTQGEECWKRHGKIHLWPSGASQVTEAWEVLLHGSPVENREASSCD